jgi:hypothetical protein
MNPRLLLLDFIPLSVTAASITGSVWCLGVPQQALSFSCSSPTASATALFTAGLAVRVETSATNPSVAYGRLHYDAMFSLTVSGSGTGFILPIMVVSGTAEPALTSDASLSLGPIQWSGSGGPHYLESECYGCRIPVVSGVAMPLELKMDVYAGTGFASARRNFKAQPRFRR